MAAVYSEEATRRYFGLGLKRLRALFGVKQMAVAQAAGYLDHTNITKIERGKMGPSLSKALALAHVFGVTVEVVVYIGHEESLNPQVGATVALALQTAGNLRCLAAGGQRSSPGASSLSPPLVALPSV